MCILMKFDYAKFGVSKVYFQTLSKKSVCVCVCVCVCVGGVGSTSPLVKEGFLLRLGQK